MNWIDWIILIIVVGNVISGLSNGFFRSAASLLGLFLGVTLACWNYHVPARVIEHFVPSRGVANVVGFILVALVVMIVVGLLGRMLAKAFHWVGLGWLDHLVGGAFGLVQGSVFVLLFVVLLLVFSPVPVSLKESKLAPPFLLISKGFTHLSAGELANQIREGVKKLEEGTPNWMKP